MKTNRKHLFSIILTALLFSLFLAVSAAAEGGTVNPRQAEILRLERMFNHKQRIAAPEDGPFLYAGTVEPVTFVQTRKPALDGYGTWSMSYNREIYGQPISTNVSILMKDYRDEYTTVYSMDYDGFPSSVSSCNIVTGGKYAISVYVKSTTSGDGGYMSRSYFTVDDDAYHTSLTEKIDQVVSDCKGSTNWETALNLHDWLTHQVYYDLDLHYYGADMILRGYGVCDGYSKAYLMMCRKAGIPVYRVNNSNHAWNLICLDGAWYLVDCTWDDPAGATTAVSGSEHHTYFCLTTELFELDHPRPWDYTDTSEIICAALDDNYNVRTKDWKGIGNKKGSTTYSAAIADQIAANRGGNYIPFEDFYYITESGGYYLSTEDGYNTIIRGWTLLAYAMGKEPMVIPGYGTVNVAVSAVFSNKVKGQPIEGYFIYSVKNFATAETGTLKLPPGLKTIQAEAFAGILSSTIVIPEGCTAIGANAFLNSGVHLVYIPDSVTSIDDTAFNGCSMTLILCSHESEAGNFAMRNGILWHYK